MDHHIEPLRLDRIDEAGKTLTAAFMDDPAYALVFPDIEERERAYSTLWPAVLRYCVRWGEAYVVDGGAGVAAWLPPGQTHTTQWRNLRSGLVSFIFKLRPEARRYFLDVLNHLDEIHERLVSEPHWYLWAIGVHPDHQSQGIASALLSHTLAKATEDNIPVFLEAITESNAEYYTHRGFELLEKGTVPGSDFPYWCMIHR